MKIKETFKKPVNKAKTRIKNNLSDTDTQKESVTISDLRSKYTSGAGVSDGFINDIYNEETLTPHREMQRIREMHMRNAFVETAVSTVADLLLGKHQEIKSSDEDTEEWFNEEFLQKTNIQEAMRQNAKDFIGYGNAYFEKRREKDEGLPWKFTPIAHPERMWITKKDGDIDGYVLEIPTNLIPKDKREKMERLTVGYGRHNRKGIYGVRYDKGEIGRNKMGQGDFKDYGRSPLASALSDHKILKEIERSMAIFARYKSVPKKLISMKGPDEEALPSDEFDDTMDDWDDLSDFENFVTNGKNIDVKDMDYAGNQADFKQMTDYFKRKITAVLGPEFYFHGENTTYAVSNSQETTFYLRIQSWRDQFLDPWQSVIKEVAAKKGLSTDVKWKLGPFDFETDKERKQKALDAWQAGGITLSTFCDEMGYPEPEEELQDAYKWDVQQDAPMQPIEQQLQELKDEFEEQER